MPARTLLAAALLSALLGAPPALAACLDDVGALRADLAALAGDEPRAAEPAPAAATGEALTGDPLNPKPAAPTTAEAPTATPTSREAEGVMPGADASVELAAEDPRAAVATALDEAEAKAASGDEAGCMASLDKARAAMPARQ